MKSYLALTWKELKAQKITAILILIAVIVYLFIRKNFRREEQANHE